tara:strand:+ start:900 stop:1289 length:390 start_codon:yes stop_codon:yes gene_type:complete
MTSIFSSLTSALESSSSVSKTNLKQITKEAAEKLQAKYPDRVPVVITGMDSKITLNKKKYLVPLDLTVGQLVYIIRKNIKDLQPSEAIFVFISDKKILPPTSALVKSIYDDYASDGFIKIDIALENTFG